MGPAASRNAKAQWAITYQLPSRSDRTSQRGVEASLLLRYLECAKKQSEATMNNLLRLEVALAFLLVSVIFIPAAIAADTASVSGEWALSVETPNGTGTPSVVFKQDGEDLTGTYKGRFGESQLKGTVKGNEIKFSVTISPQGQDLVLEYSGTVDGDSMKGKAKFGEFGEGNFTGKKKSADTAK
jgi:hypothetical protein